MMTYLWLLKDSQHFLKKQKVGIWRNFIREKCYKEESSNMDNIICYESKKPGHMKYDCSNFKIKLSLTKKKTIKVTNWDDKNDSVTFLTDDDSDFKEIEIYVW